MSFVREYKIAQTEKEFLAEHIVRLAETSWKMETERYSSLLSSSGRLLTSISIFSVALLSFLPTVIKVASIEKLIVFEYGVIFVFLIASFMLALIAQYRFKYKEVLSPEDLSNHVFKERDCFNSAEDSAKQFAGILEDPYKSIRNRNEKISSLLKASTVSLVVAIGILLFFGLLDIVLLLQNY